MSITVTGSIGVLLVGLVLMGISFVLIALAVRWGRNMSVRDLCAHEWHEVVSTEYSETFRCRRCRARRIDHKSAPRSSGQPSADEVSPISETRNTNP